MSLKDKISEDLKVAMRAGDELRRDTLRAVIAEIQKAQIPPVVEHKIAPGDTWGSIGQKYEVEPGRLARAYGVTEGDPIPKQDEDNRPLTKLVVALPVKAVDDHEVQAVIAKHVKQRRDSIDAFQKAGRADLVDRETAELRVLEAYLPAQLDRQQIAEEARTVIAEVGAGGPADKGKVMSALMPRLAGRADGRTINEIVTGLLATPATDP